MVTWAERCDELRRTTFEGQIALDGSVTEHDVVAPRAHSEPEAAEGDVGDEAPGADCESSLFGD